VRRRRRGDRGKIGELDALESDEAAVCTVDEPHEPQASTARLLSAVLVVQPEVEEGEEDAAVEGKATSVGLVQAQAQTERGGKARKATYAPLRLHSTAILAVKPGDGVG